MKGDVIIRLIHPREVPAVGTLGPVYYRGVVVVRTPLLKLGCQQG